MSRYRINSAPSEIDREVAERLEEVERSVRRALQACEKHDRATEDRPEKLRTRRVGRDLQHILAAVSDVRKVRSGLLIDEPSEAEKRAAEKRAAEKRAADKAAADKKKKSAQSAAGPKVERQNPLIAFGSKPILPPVRVSER